jgi:hypothetical protein
MDGCQLIKTNINFVYEFKTPNGFLPIGSEYHTLPIIFDYVNDLEYQRGIVTHRLGYSNSFRILNDRSSTYDTLTLNKVNIPNKMLYSLTNNEINNDINLYCIDASHDETIVDYIKRTNLTNVLSDISKNLFKEKENFKLMVLDNYEGSFDFDSEFFESFKRFHTSIGLKSDTQIIFVTNTCNAQDMYDTFLRKTGYKSFMRVKSVQFFIYDSGKTISEYFIQTNGTSDIIIDNTMEYSVPTESEIVDNTRNKYYLFLNRNSGRLHRAKLLLKFIKNNIFDKGITSFLHSDEFDRFADEIGNEEYRDLIKSKYPFVADYEDPYLVSDMHNFFTKKEMWMDTYFSVVSETSADDRWCFITEKTVRPMIYFHPFIIWGNPGTLKTLKDLGFETFPEFFDESYDSVKNSELRMKMILNDVKRLCEIPIEQMHELYQSVIPKLIHNRNLLIEMYKRKEVYTKVLETLF